MKKKKTLLSVVSALILSLSIVGAASAGSPSQPVKDDDGAKNRCVEAGLCLRT